MTESTIRVKFDVDTSNLHAELGKVSTMLRRSRWLYAIREALIFVTAAAVMFLVVWHIGGWG